MASGLGLGVGDTYVMGYFAILLANFAFDWLCAMGGLELMAENNIGLACFKRSRSKRRRITLC
jgi:hypothetical protein